MNHKTFVVRKLKRENLFLEFPSKVQQAIPPIVNSLRKLNILLTFFLATTLNVLYSFMHEIYVITILIIRCIQNINVYFGELWRFTMLPAN